MKTITTNPQKIFLNVIISLVCMTFSANAQLLLNGNFESGTNNRPEFWQPNAWLNHGTVFKWENGTGIGGSKCISIENTESNDARWTQCVKLIGNTTYEFSGYIKGEKIQNNQNDDIFSNLSVLEIWGFGQVTKSDFEWTNVTFRFTTNESGYYTLCARNGYYGNVTTGKCWFDNLTLKEIEMPRLDTINGNQIVFYLRESDLVNISEANLTRWIDHLDSAILKYEELTGHEPNTGYPLKVLSVEDYPGGWAVAGNPIKWYQIYIGTELKMINDHDDWSFGILHEIGHNFDYPYWNFHGEHFANFKMFYVIQELNGRFWRDGNYIVGHDYKDYYKGVYNMVRQHYKSTGEILHLYGDALTYKFIDIADSIGWEPFKKSFRAYLENPSISQHGNIKKYYHFLDMLTRNSAKDVRQYLSWDDRNEFVLYLGSMNYPNPPSDLQMKERNCKYVTLEWKDRSENEEGFILQKRTENNWYSGEIVLGSGSTSYCDSTLCKDSTYFYRIRSYNSFGQSDFSKELEVRRTIPPETPCFSQHHWSFNTGDTLHLSWTADTIFNDSVLWSFMIDDPDAVGHTTYYLKASLDFNRQLKTGIEINNMMDSSRCYMVLNLDLDPGNWSIDIDSIFLSKPLFPTFFQWIPMYDMDDPSWKIEVKDIVEIFRNGFKIEVVFNKLFCGNMKASICGLDGCGNVGAKEMFYVDIIPEISKPELSHNYIEICEGEQLPEILAEGENVQWYTDSCSPLYDFRDGQIYDVVTIGEETWMNENMNYATSSDTIYPYYHDSMHFFISSGSIYPYHDSIHFGNYGRLYFWGEASSVCPMGWEISTREEWENLIELTGGDTESLAVAGFKIGPAGQSIGYPYEQFQGYGQMACYWNPPYHASSKNTPGCVFTGNGVFGYEKPGMFLGDYRFSIRCVKNDSLPVYLGNALPLKYLEPGLYKFYANQRIGGYEGALDTLIIKVNPVPDPPLAVNYEICENDGLPEMTVSGDYISWYSDPELMNLLNIGNSYTPTVTNMDTTPYFVTQTMQNCVGKSDTILLVIHSRPTFELGKDTTIFNDQRLVIGTDEIKGDFLWSDGSKVANLEVDGRDVGIGEHCFWLTITNEHGCDFSDTIRVNVIQTNTTENTLKSDFTVFPNPAHDLITLLFEKTFKGNIIIQLVDYTGNIVYLDETANLPHNNRVQFDISSLPKGIYVFRIKSRDYTVSEKILLH